MAKKMKHAATDFDVSALPQNRKEVFFDILKFQWKKLLFCGLIVFLFSLPLTLAFISDKIYLVYLNAQLATANLTQTEYETAYRLFQTIESLIEIPLFMLLSIGLAGVARIIRQLVWQENVKLSYDFTHGIKQNFGQFFALSIIIGIARFIVTFYFRNLAALGSLKWIGFVMIALGVMLVVPVFCYMLVTITSYSNKFSQNLRLGYVVFFKSPFKTLGVMLSLYALFALKLIPVFLCKLICSLILPFITGIIMSIWFLFSFNRLDKFIHPNYYPELINKGVLGLTLKQSDTDQSEER